MGFGQYGDDTLSQDKPAVQALYQQLLASGSSQKDAAKEAQARTGVSLVSGRPIVKKVEWTPKVNYGGQYPEPRSLSTVKRTKPAAWPR